MRWIKDEEFIRGNVPMTKFNIRALTLAYLAIEEGDRLLDIGAGTGSISIESQLHGVNVWAIERETKAIDLIKANNKKFDTKIKIIKGEAPKDLPDLYFNKCFIGGSGGRLKEIFEYLDKHLENGGILCGNFITLKNVNEFIGLLEEYNYEKVTAQLVQSSYMDKIGLMKGQNPIFIIKGEKTND